MKRNLVQITLSCEPQEVPLLQATTISELRKLQEDGPREDEIRAAVEADRRNMETAERTNAYWLHTYVLDSSGCMARLLLCTVLFCEEKSFCFFLLLTAYSCLLLSLFSH